MKQSLQPNNPKNEINSKEKSNLLHLLRNNKTNNKLQTYLYQRGDQSTIDNGGAKYIELTQDGLYEEYIESPEEKIRESLNVRKELEGFDTVFDLGPGGGRTVKYINPSQLYRPIDVSAYVIDQLKKISNFHIEGTIGDRFKTKVFQESQGEKAYVIGKTIPNFSDEEIIQLTQSLQPTKDGKSKLIVSYFPEFNETQDNINKLLAMYGDPDSNNPYHDKQSHERVSKFVTGLFISLGFPQEDIEQDVRYDKKTKIIILTVRIKKDITIQADKENFTWKAGEHIPVIHSRRMSDNHVQNLFAKSGRKRKQHKSDQRIAVDVFEKTDPHKKQNAIKKRAKIGLITLGLGTAVVAGKSIHDQYQKDVFIEQKQKQIEENLLLSYSPAQIAYFNEQINETKQIIKTFYGIKDDGYINGLMRPYMMAHPDLVEYIIKQKGSYGTISPIGTSIGEYIAMFLMKDQEKHNFLEYYGDDILGYKKFDAYIPNMLNTLQYYDSIYTTNNSYEVKSHQELKIRPTSTSSTGASPILSSTNYLGTGIIYPGIKANIYTINNPTLLKKDNGKIFLVAEDDNGLGFSEDHSSKMFIEKYLSYGHQTKYIARQTSNYINEQLEKNNAKIDKSISHIHTLEHIIQFFVLHGGNSRKYLKEENIGKAAFENIILKNPKHIKYFREQLLIDLETMQQLPGYESRRGKYAMARGESQAYRNNLDYQKANRDFFKRD